ncbi:MAG: zinc ribbon domain-containing protein [Pyrinomonadaceae bacterium]
MFCPQCGSTQPDDLNFCKSCGANLNSVRTALAKPAGTEDFNWNRTWLAETLMTRDEKDRVRGITREGKRRREIKAGVITLSSGVSLSVVLSVLMEAIVINGNLSLLAADILSRIWIVGLIPALVGLALIVNGVFISPRGTEEREQQPSEPSPLEMPAAGTQQLASSAVFSVTDETTRHLSEPVPIERMKTK